MKSQELYNDIPPSLKRKKSPFIKAGDSEFIKKIADFLLDRFLRQTFSKIRVKNFHNFDLRDMDYSNLFYAPHCCWWDGLLGYFLGRQVFKTNMRIMTEELHACPFLAKLGAFSVDKGSTSLIRQSLAYSISLLEHKENSLYIFPQGIIRPPDFRPVKFKAGITYMASKLNGVNLIPLAVRYSFLRETAPEILIDVQRPIIVDKVSDRKFLNRFLEDSFEDSLDKQRDDISQGDLRGYETVWQRPDSLSRVIEKRLKN